MFKLTKKPINVSKIFDKNSFFELLQGQKFTNPSIAHLYNKFFILNRKIFHNKNKEDNFISSKNLLLILDEQLQEINFTQIEENETRNFFIDCKNGLEDGRLFIWKEKIFCLFSCYAFLNGQHFNKMMLCELEDNQIKNAQIINSPTNANREKNWMPLVKDEKLFIVYSTFPLIIYELKDNALLPLTDKIEDINLHNERSPISGSSTFLLHDDKYYGIVHKKIFLSPPHRLILKLKREIFKVLNKESFYSVKKVRYIHYLLVLDKDLKIESCSKPFYFEEKGVEFVAGISIVSGYIYITYGLLDIKAKLFKTNFKDFLKAIF